MLGQSNTDDIGDNEIPALANNIDLGSLVKISVTRGYYINQNVDYPVLP